MFGKFFKSIPIKNTKSDDFMQNLSSTKKENIPVQTVNNNKKTSTLTSEIKEQFEEKRKELNVKTCVSNDFINMINEAKNEIDSKKILSKDEHFEEVYNNGLYYIHEFSEKPENKENLKLALNFFAEATTIKKNKAEPYYFLSYICYLVNDITLAEEYFKISSYLKPDQKNLMSLGSKISSAKYSRG